MKREIWRDIKGYEGHYKVSNFGNIRVEARVFTDSIGRTHNVKQKPIKKGIDTCGYEQVILSKNGSRKSYKVHRLVILAFLGADSTRTCVNHKNGVKTDNNITNLEWCTHGENNRHAYRNKLRKRSSKLSEEDVIIIRDLFSRGVKTKKELSFIFEIGISTVNDLIAYRTFKEVK